MLPEYKKKQKEIEEQNNNIDALTQRVSNLEKVINAVQGSYKMIETGGNDKGVLIKCIRTDYNDKYAISVTGASNTSSTPVDTILRINHSNTAFNGTVLNNGVALSGITYKLINNVGYIHIPIAAYSTIQAETYRGVKLTVTNEAMPS